MTADPVIKRIRDIRKKISEKFNHSPEEYINFLRQQEQKHAEKIIDNPKSKKDEMRVF